VWKGDSMLDKPTTAAVVPESFALLLTDLRAIIATGRGRAAAAVNQELVATYWAVW